MIFIGDDALLTWIGERLPEPIRAEEFKPCLSLGIVRGGKVVAGVVYNNYRGRDMEMSIASSSARWATPAMISLLLAIPFERYGTARVTASTPKKHRRTRDFLERIGFQLEGRLRDAAPQGDLLVYGMTKKEFLRSKWNGEKNACGTRSNTSSECASEC